MKSIRLASRTRRLATATALAGALVAAAGIAVAQPAGPGPGMAAPRAAGHGDGMRRGERRHMAAEHLLAAAEQLDLSDAQKTKLKEIRRKAPSMLMPKRQAVIEARMDLHDLLSENATSAADLKRAHDKLQKAQDEMQSAAFDLRIQAREVLTPEQRDKLHKAMRSGHRMGRGPGRMGDAGFAPFGPGDDGLAPFAFDDEGPEDEEF